MCFRLIVLEAALHHQGDLHALILTGLHVSFQGGVWAGAGTCCLIFTLSWIAEKHKTNVGGFLLARPIVPVVPLVFVCRELDSENVLVAPAV